MATKPLTTTYNELKKLGACKEGLATLLEWCKKHPENNGSYKQLRLTPADILESNGLSHLYWATSVVPSWNKSWQAWFVSGGGGISGWAKEVSKKPEPNIGFINAQINQAKPKPLAKYLEVGDRIRVGGIEGSVTYQGRVTSVDVKWDVCGGARNTFDHRVLDAMGFTLIEPKREPCRLKAESGKFYLAERATVVGGCLYFMGRKVLLQDPENEDNAATIALVVNNMLQEAYELGGASDV